MKIETFIRTFHNCDYDAAEFDDKLSYDRSVPLPVRPTQTLYNKPDNWRQRNRIGLEKLKERLEKYWVSNTKTFSLHLTHNHEQLVDDEEPIVWHEPILDHYWTFLEAGIPRWTRGIQRIMIENIEITKEHMASLVTALSTQVNSNDQVHYIQFNNINLCDKGIISLSKLVDDSSKLNTLTIIHNRIDNMESARCLSRSLRNHARINHIIMTHCGLGSSPTILSIILQSYVSIINLSNNNIDSLGAVKIAEYLEGDPPIEHLFLGHNRLNDDDAVLISQALKRNTNLRRIDLRSNNFTSIGVKALLTCAFDSSSLNAISESNHTLTRIIFFTDTRSYIPSHIDNLAGCINRMFDLNRTQKILLALQDKESLLKYLANVPLGLMPEVLDFLLQRDGNQHQGRNLGIVYSIMRWWNMLMLYSYH